MRDLVDSFKVKSLVMPTIVKAPIETEVIYRDCYDSLAFIISVGEASKELSQEKQLKFVLTHGEDPDNLQPVNVHDIISDNVCENGVVLTLNDARHAKKSYRLGYVGEASYLKLQAQPKGKFANGVPLCCVALLGDGHNMPPESFADSFADLNERLL